MKLSARSFSGSPARRSKLAAGRDRRRRYRPEVAGLESRTLLASGLVAAYGFNTGSGTTLVDSSGNGNNGTISGASWVTDGEYGDALSFNGTNSWVTIPDAASLDLTSGITIDAWVNPSALGGSGAIAAKEQTGGLSYALYAAGSANAPPAGLINTGGSNVNVSGTSALPLNTWSFLAETYNGSSLALYVNGTLVQTTAASGSIAEPGGVLRIGGDSITGDYFDGLIDELRVYNVALTASQIQTDMSTPVNPPGDTQPPTVSLTAPANNATVSNTVTISATASDEVAVADVQFQVDGSNLGAPVTAAPYTFSWDTTQFVNGPHTLTAVATDVGGLQTTSAAVQVTVSNTQPTQGQWSPVMNWGLVAINQVLLDNGDVLMWDGGPTCIGSTSATVYNPNTGTFTPVPVPTNPTTDNDIFCSGMATLANGDILVVGGHDCTGVHNGADTTNIFNPATDTWTSGPTMSYYRWYPTATTLPSGNVLITTGSQYNNTDYVPIPELYNASTNTLTTLTNSPIGVQNYPFMFVLPNGNVLEAGSDEGAYQSEELNLSTMTWSVVDPNVVDGSSAVEYQPGKILKAGASDPETSSNSAPSSATAYVLDTTQATPRWQQTASMSSPRTWLNLTMLPDGNVLATGGGTDLGGVNPANAVYSAEEWSPTTQTWTTLASMSVPRLYHSTALLLPSGQVLVAGGGENYVNNDNYPSAQLYSPPYLFNGPRPTITSAPTTLQYGQNFTVQTPNAASIASVSLIRMGDVTHSVNMGQSFQNLTFQQTSGGLTVQAPANAALATPGYYMLFIVNSKGVPSVAAIVQIPVGSGDTQPPTAPTNLTATSGTSTVALSWTASTDNVGVVGYNVYRSTTSGFTPSPSNIVGQTTGTTYTDTTGAGTFYYVVEAYDAAGNLSPPSNQATATVTAPGIKLVQDATKGSESSGASISVAFPANTRAGDFLIVTGAASAPRENMTISDSEGDTFVSAIGPSSDTAQNATEYVWYVANAKGGADTVTLTPSSADALEIHVSEWSGVSASSPVDQTAFGTGSGTSVSSGSKTTTQSGDLIYGYTFVAGSAVAGAGFTGLTSIDGDEDEYQIQGAAGSAAATFSQNPSGDWSSVMVAFRSGTADTQPPTAPSNLSATGAIGSVGLTWTASTDNVGVVGYDIYRSTTSGFAPSSANMIGQSTTTSYTDKVAAGTYYYLVTAYDAAGNVSTPSNQATGVSSLDTQPPTAPTNLLATGGTVSVGLTWTASTDNVGVVGYDIYRSTTNGFTPSSANMIGQSTTTSYTDKVAAGTYYYLVTAYDAAGNVSTPSNQATGVSAPDTQPPSVTITAPVSGASVAGTVSVTATASDNVAVASVQFQLDGNNLGAAITSAPYTYSWNTTTVTNGSHLLTAIATDTSGNQATSSENVTVNNTSSLVASYGFNEGSGTTTADGSGNGNTGTLVNATWTTAGKAGDAIKFNGTNSTVVVNDAPSIDLTTGMTLEAWVYPTSLSNSGGNWDAAIAKEHVNSSNDIAYALYAAAGTNAPPAVHILVSGKDYRAQGTSVLPLNTWTFLAGTYDGKTLKMYVNGNLVGSTSISGKITTTTNPLKFGGDWDNEMFTGTIDSVEIYNTALTQSQIQGNEAAPLITLATTSAATGPASLLLKTSAVAPIDLVATTPATHIWTGADGSLWSDAGNWIGGAPTEPGARLVFPAGESNLSTTNDLVGETIGSIVFAGGGYAIGGDPLTIQGGISTAAGATGIDTINANLALGGDQPVFVPETRATVVLGGVVSGQGGLIKTGEGRLVLSGANTYAGATHVDAGVLDVASRSALGLATGGTFVASGAAIDVEGSINVPEPLTIDGSGPDGAGALNSVGGTNDWTGPITLASNSATIGVVSGSTLTLRGVFDGPGGLTKVGLGYLVEQMFAGNDYPGPTTITAGSVLLDSVNGVAVPGALIIDPSPGSGTVTVGCGRDNRTAPTSTLTINGSGVLDLMNHAITFASVTMDGGTITTRDRGELDLGGDITVAAGSSSTIAGVLSLGQTSHTATIGAGGTLTISAVITGSGSLVRQGAGKLVLSNSGTVSGSTTNPPAGSGSPVSTVITSPSAPAAPVVPPIEEPPTSAAHVGPKGPLFQNSRRPSSRLSGPA